MFSRQIAEASSPGVNVFIWLAQALDYQGNSAEALKQLRDASIAFSGSPGLKTALAGLLERARRDHEAEKLLVEVLGGLPGAAYAGLSLVKLLLRKGDTREARNVVWRLEMNGEPGHAAIMAARAHLDIAEKLGKQAIGRLNMNVSPFMHTSGILLECYVACAEQLAGADRAEVANMGLAQAVPDEFKANANIIVERTRLAALAGEEQVFAEELARLDGLKFGVLRKPELTEYGVNGTRSETTCRRNRTIMGASFATANIRAD
jgi:hypothetical protein